MYKIQEKISDYIKTHSIKQLMRESGVGSFTIYRILNGNEKYKTFQKDTLNNLYQFFNLKKDEFYHENIRKTINPKNTQNPLGVIFKAKRLKLGLTEHEVAKRIKGSDRHIKRLEKGEVNYDINSYYFRELLKLYKFTPDETNTIISYSLSFYNINKLSKKVQAKCPFVERK